jgi:hypothetical protein
MRKYIIAIIILSLGIITLVFSLIQNSNDIYPEEVFKEESIRFDNSFNSFTNTISNNISEIKKTFSDTLAIKHIDNTERYFLKLAQNNPYLISIIFIQNNNKFIINKSQDSYILAIDSTKNIDVINWKRYKNNKQISNWDESFELKVNQLEWFKDLSKTPNKLKWFFNTQTNNNISEDNELFYAAYTYTINGSINTILFRFSRLGLLNEFSTYSKYDNVNLLIQTNDGHNLNLSSGITETFKEITMNENSVDSFRIQTLKHFERFDGKESGIFNFNYNDIKVWNYFKKPDSAIGINFYILSIDNNNLLSSLNKELPSNLFFWISIVLIILSIVLFLFKYFSGSKIKQSGIPKCMDILKEDESRTLEFKSSLRWDYRQEKVNPELEKVIFKTIAAFGNTDGGILLIGIDDDKNILGLDSDFKTLKKPNTDFFEIHLRNLLHTQMGIKYVSKNIRMQFEEVEPNKFVCKIMVLAADKALFLKMKDKNGHMTEKFYVRSGNSSQEIKSIADINEYLNDRFNN